MSIRLHVYAPIKDEYFYINQKVKDTRDNKEGIIYKCSIEGFSTEPMICVRYPNLRKAYVSSQIQYLEKLNPGH